MVSATTQVPYSLIRQWKMQPWWEEYVKEIRNTQNLKMDDKLSRIVERSLDAVADRLENGEKILNNKTGEFISKPVNMKDAAKVATDLLTKRELLRGNATSRTEAQQIPVADQLKQLAEAFAKMSNPPKEVIDVDMVEVLDSEVQDVVEAIDDFEEEDEDAFHEEWETGLQEADGVAEPSGSGEETFGEQSSS